MPKKKPVLPTYDRHALEFISKHGPTSNHDLSPFLWPLSVARGHSSHGGPNRGDFRAALLLGRLDKKGLIRWIPSRRKHKHEPYGPTRYRLTDLGHKTLDKARKEDGPPADILIHKLQAVHPETTPRVAVNLALVYRNNYFFEDGRVHKKLAKYVDPSLTKAIVALFDEANRLT